LWKYTASNRPPKAEGNCQAFDIRRYSTFADGKARRHHKAFLDEGEMPQWRKISVPRHMASSHPPSPARNDDETWLLDLAECFFREVFVCFPPSKQRAQGMPGGRCAR
jgi:hypothetical protein